MIITNTAANRDFRRPDMLVGSNPFALATLLSLSRSRHPNACVAFSDPLPAISDQLPFLCDYEALGEDVVYKGFGATLLGRDQYVATSRAWREDLPNRLRALHIRDKVVLPPDARGFISARYVIAFEAPVPPQILPAQRARVANAALERTADGKVCVEARVACTVQLDSKGRVIRHTEALAVDPFAVTATIAHFELVYARHLAVAIGRAHPSPLDAAIAWWVALRELTRQELDEVVRRSRSDELVVLEGADEGVSDAEFNEWFAVFVGRNFLSGALIGATAYYALKTIGELAAPIPPP